MRSYFAILFLNRAKLLCRREN